MGFPDNFIWGAASAAHQIEGAYLEAGKGLGIWDALHEGHIKHHENGNVACDHFHRYKEDIAIMKKLGLKSYRFSVSWPRIVPEEGKINKEGLQFYINLVNELKQADIEPICTLFHWNLPVWIHEQGGWNCEKAAFYFAEYTKIVVQALSDLVKYWITINEPQCFIGLGYNAGKHAPFLQLPEQISAISRNVMLAHGRSVQTIRTYAKQAAMIGMAPTGGCAIPTSNTKLEIERAREATYSDKAGVMGNKWWADPMVLGEVPEALDGILSKQDMEVIHQPLDFYAFNIYYAANYAEQNDARNPLVYPGMARTSMGWPITPDVLYWAPKFHYERYHLPVLISENGMANNDFVMEDGRVHDPQRTDYIRSYLRCLRKAIDDGVPTIGYLYWSIMDNFEWAEGYDKRFGLIYIDYRTQERVIKDSAYDYAEIIRNNGNNL